MATQENPKIAPKDFQINERGEKNELPKKQTSKSGKIRSKRKKSKSHSNIYIDYSLTYSMDDFLNLKVENKQLYKQLLRVERSKKAILKKMANPFKRAHGLYRHWMNKPQTG